MHLEKKILVDCLSVCDLQIWLQSSSLFRGMDFTSGHQSLAYAHSIPALSSRCVFVLFFYVWWRQFKLENLRRPIQKVTGRRAYSDVTLGDKSFYRSFFYSDQNSRRYSLTTTEIRLHFEHQKNETRPSKFKFLQNFNMMLIKAKHLECSNH